MNHTVADLSRQLANLIAVVVGIMALATLPLTQDGGAREHVVGADPLLAAAPGAALLWLPLVAWILLYAVWQALPAQRAHPLLRRVGWWTATAAAGNVVAAFCHARGHPFVAWATVATVVAALLQVERESRGVGGDDQGLVRAPFGLLLGWMCMSLLLQSAQVLHVVLRADVNPVLGIFGAIAGIVGIAAVGIFFALLHDNHWLGAAIAWGLGAVALERQELPSFAFLAALAALIVVVAIVASLLVDPGPERSSLPSGGAAKTA